MFDMVVSDDQLVRTMADVALRSIDRPLIQSMFTRHEQVQVRGVGITDDLRVVRLIVDGNHVEPRVRVLFGIVLQRVNAAVGRENEK